MLLGVGDVMIRKQSHVILCALSDLKPQRAEKYYTYKPSGFRHGEVRDEYYAYHTNEGPVKLLVDKAQRDGSRIDRIVYLCSKECETDQVVLEEGLFTAEQYFVSHITSFVKDELGLDWIGKGFFLPISYKVGLADECLGSVINALGENVTVDIDVSGAQRDAEILLTHAIEFIQIGNDNVNLGTTVYANFNTDPKTLTCLDSTYKLSGLISSIDSFVRYGRAEGLSEFFSDGCAEVRELCKSMSDFSADLSVCRVGGIQDSVNRLYESIDRLENRAKKGGLSNGETLFATLASSIRSGFAEQMDNDADQTLAIIRWCISHDMLQQALSLYRESFFTLLCQKGWVKRGKSMILENDATWHKELRNKVSSWVKDGVCSYSGLEDNETTKSNRCMSRIKLQDEKSARVLAIDKGCEPVVLANFAWFYLLWTIRNDVMHAKSVTGIVNRLEFIEEVAKVMGTKVGFDPRYDKAVKDGLSCRECNDALAADMLDALKAIEGESRLWLDAE
jgi:hypothetical protein